MIALAAMKVIQQIWLCRAACRMQTRTQPTRREYDTARAKCRDKYQSDKCREGLRQSEASVATGPGTTNQSTEGV